MRENKEELHFNWHLEAQGELQISEYYFNVLF